MHTTKTVPDFEIDLSYLEEIANGNTDFIIEMIDLFLQQAPESLALISDKINKKEFNAVGNTAHKLKPTFAMIGVLAGRELAERIEKSSRGAYELELLPELVEELTTIATMSVEKLNRKKQDLIH